VEPTTNTGGAQPELAAPSESGSAGGSTDRLRVPVPDDVLRIDGGDERVSRVVAVVWEPDGCITLELDQDRDGAPATEDAPSDIPEWWLG
jgi:hypothetical protein